MNKNRKQINKEKTLIEDKKQNQLQKLEQQPSFSFVETHHLDSNIDYPIENPELFLYHGICHGNPFEKLENILKEKKILAGNQLPSSYYIPYDDNANEGNHISLLEYQSRKDITYKIFIMPNITLVIKPINNAIKTIYVPYETWCDIQEYIPEHKNRYSYAQNEYQVKDFIPIENVIAIGIPYHYFSWTNKKNIAIEYQEKVHNLLEKYQLSIPIIDTSWNNYILVPTPEHSTKKSLTRKKH